LKSTIRDVPATASQVVINAGREEELLEPVKETEDYADGFDVETELLHHMASLGVTDPDEIRRLTEAHIHAAAAAKVSRTIPLHEKTYPNLGAVPQKVPEKKERPVKMRLDPKWLEIKDLGPRLEDMWVFVDREEQVVDTYGMRAGTLIIPPAKGIEF
jgi:hypothetical protein